MDYLGNLEIQCIKENFTLLLFLGQNNNRILQEVQNQFVQPSRCPHTCEVVTQMEDLSMKVSLPHLPSTKHPCDVTTQLRFWLLNFHSYLWNHMEASFSTWFLESHTTGQDLFIYCLKALLCIVHSIDCCSVPLESVQWSCFHLCNLFYLSLSLAQCYDWGLF